MNKIIKNAIKCRVCGETIESKHRHDFQTCDCGYCSVDGGLDYLKRVGNDEDYEDLSIVLKDVDSFYSSGFQVDFHKIVNYLYLGYTITRDESDKVLTCDSTIQEVMDFATTSSGYIHLNDQVRG